MWRSKQMTGPESVVFRRVFEAVYDLSIMNDDMALVLSQRADGPRGTVAMTGHQSAFLELASPGGWKTCDPPSEDGWLLVTGDCRFNPNLPAVSSLSVLRPQ
jgi:hypothetical protein